MRTNNSKEESYPLTTIWLTLNRICQFNCEWCYSNRATRVNDMSIDKAVEVIDSLSKKGAKKVILIGGEPLLYPDLFTIIRHIKNSGMKASIATNGKRLIDQSFCADLVDTGIDSVNISLKGLSEEEYVNNVGKSGFFNAIEGYQNLRKLSFSPSLSYVIVSDDVSHSKKLANVMQKYKLNNISFQYYKPIVEQNPPVLMELNTMGLHLCQLFDIMNTSDITYTIEISFPLCLIPKERRKDILNSGKVYSGCHIRRCSGIVYDTDFSIIPCNHFANLPYKETKEKGFNPLDLETLRKSKSFNDFHNQISYYPSKECSICDLWIKCGGGCFTRWLSCNPNDFCHHISKQTS